MSSNDDDSGASGRADRERRAQLRADSSRQAADGLHLPDVHELLLGCKWLGNDLVADAKVYAERFMPRIDATTLPGAEVIAALSALTVEPRTPDFIAAATAFSRALDIGNFLLTADAPGFVPSDYLDAKKAVYAGPDAAAGELRCQLYAAAAGDPASCLAVAGHALVLAQSAGAPIDEASMLVEAAVGWLAASQDCRPVWLSRKRPAHRWSDLRDDVRRHGDMLVREVLRHHELDAADKEAVSDATKTPRRQATSDHGMENLDLDETDDVAETEKGIVVIPDVGNIGTHEGKRILESYKPVVGVRLPLPPVPDLAAVRRNLVAEFPHAAVVIDSILRDLGSRDTVRLRPTILVGEPGCGKTTLAVRLLTALGIGHQVYPCGGAADSSIAGTPRQWSTGSPSVPVSLVARHRTAAPGIILDEVEKVATSRHNGNLMDSLLAMLEPVSAVRWLDPYTQSECDLSHVIWLGTANTLDGVPAPLRDRCRVLRFPSPGPEHMPTLAAALLRKAVEELGQSAEWALPLDGVELQALGDTWPGGSLRGLRRLVNGVLAARDHSMACA